MDMSFCPRHRRLTLALGAALLAALLGCATPPTPLSAIDLARFSGTWYQAAALPHRAQSHCDSDDQIDFQPQDNGLRVLSRCLDRDGRPIEARGIATLIRDGGQARLSLRYRRPVAGELWVLALDHDYRWALVGEPGRRQAWILSRSTSMPAGDLDAALSAADQQGWIRGDFRPTLQLGRLPPAAR